jgi:hypothetical protein
LVSNDITREFPHPTKLIKSAFGQLHVARIGSEEAKKVLGPLTELPRPWDPPSCPPTLRHELWLWLDRVAGWLNHEYTWQTDRVIPSCWPAHPNIAHEIAVLACLRWTAGRALTADSLDDWHRYALPGFLDRMSTRLGGQPCQPGTHKSWPGASRFTEFESPAALGKRCEAFTTDTRKHPNESPPLPALFGSHPTQTTLTVDNPTGPAEGSKR